MSLRPTVSLNEAAQGSGGLCGGTFLNRIFAAHIDRKFRNTPEFDAEHKKSLMRLFENTIKKTFSGDLTRVYTIAVRGVRDSVSLGVLRETLTITGQELAPIFNEVIEKVTELVLDQMQSTKGRVKAVLLAGGFGKSNYLRRKLQQAVTGVERSTRVETINNRHVHL